MREHFRRVLITAAKIADRTDASERCADSPCSTNVCVIACTINQHADAKDRRAETIVRGLVAIVSSVVIDDRDAACGTTWARKRRGAVCCARP